jgi:short-subunit dehydrogenase
MTGASKDIGLAIVRELAASASTLPRRSLPLLRRITERIG